MSWYAIDAIDEAFETARSFLFPFEIGRWLRLAVIVFFLGGASSGNVQFPQTGSTDVYPSVPLENTLLVGIVLFVLVLFVLFGLIGSVMQFVLLDSIRSDSVHIRRYFRAHLGKGMRLFLFAISVLLVAAIPIVIGVWALTTGLMEGSVFALSMVVLFLFVLVAALFVAVLLGFTNSFVAPVMIIEECGVLDGWQRFWPTLKGEWKQYTLYVVLNWFLSLAVGIVVWIVMALVVLAMALVAAIPTVAGYIFSPEIGLVALLLFGLFGLLVTLVSAFVIQIPVQIYFRYYSLLVLRKTNPAFDLVPYVDDDPNSESTAVGE